jgi:hypothetical protein
MKVENNIPVMDPVELRELKHIVKNYSSNKKVSGYRTDTHSDILKAVYGLAKRKIIEPVETKGYFVYMRPAKDFFMKLSEIEKLQFEVPYDDLETW